MADVKIKRKLVSGYEDINPKTTWGQVDGKPSTFTPTAHNHDYLPLTGGTLTNSTTPLVLSSGSSPNITFHLGGTATTGDYKIQSWGSSRHLSLESMGDVSINIDHNNNTTDKKFTVRHNGEGSAGTVLFEVNEAGGVLAGGQALVKTNDARLSDARTPLAHNQAWSTITSPPATATRWPTHAEVTSKPTTLSGYGITDALASSLKGAASGLAELDASGHVPSSQLPSYVDDVLEYANFVSFPAPGETGKIYVRLDTNVIYRWSGTAYVEISSSLALGETSSTAYRGDRGKTAYDHTALTNNPHSVTAAQAGALGLTAKAADSSKLDGLLLHTGRNNEANKVVRTQGNGYVDFGWINTTSGNTSSAVTDVYVNTNDGYIRKKTLALFKTELGSMPPTSHGNEAHSSTFLTGNQVITLSGDLTGSGATAISAAIGDGKVTLAKMANLTANTIMGNNTESAATPIALTVAQVKAQLAYTKSDVGLSVVENKTSATIRGEITSANVTGGLGFTPYNATNPSNYSAAGATGDTHAGTAHAPSNATAAGATGDTHAGTAHAPSNATAAGATGDTHAGLTTGSVHGSTMVGERILRVPNPGALNFIRINADHTVSTIDAATARTNLDVPPLNHAVSNVNHGAATAVNWGHVRIGSGINVDNGTISIPASGKGFAHRTLLSTTGYAVIDSVGQSISRRWFHYQIMPRHETGSTSLPNVKVRVRVNTSVLVEFLYVYGGGLVTIELLTPPQASACTGSIAGIRGSSVYTAGTPDYFQHLTNNSVTGAMGQTVTIEMSVSSSLRPVDVYGLDG